MYQGHLTLDMMRVIMGEEKKSDLDRVTFTSDTLRKYFPKKMCIRDSLYIDGSVFNMVLLEKSL